MKYVLRVTHLHELAHFECALFELIILQFCAKWTYC